MSKIFRCVHLTKGMSPVSIGDVSLFISWPHLNSNLINHPNLQRPANKHSHPKEILQDNVLNQNAPSEALLHPESVDHPSSNMTKIQTLASREDRLVHRRHVLPRFQSY